jgi:hypothetical protein
LQHQPAILPTADDVDAAEIALGDQGAGKAQGIVGFLLPRRARPGGQRRAGQLVEGIEILAGAPQQFGVAAVAGKEDHAGNVLPLEPGEEGLPLLGEVVPAFEGMVVIRSWLPLTMNLKVARDWMRACLSQSSCSKPNSTLWVSTAGVEPK